MPTFSVPGLKGLPEKSSTSVVRSSVRVFVSMQYFVPIAHKVKYFKFG